MNNKTDIDDSTLKLSELMRGLEIPPSFACESPEFFFAMGQAIAAQAKLANPILRVDQMTEN